MDKNNELTLTQTDRFCLWMMVAGIAVGSFGMGIMVGIWWTFAWAR
jgi:hypothetical protein